MNTQPSQLIYTLHVTRNAMLSSGPSPEEAVALRAHVDYLERFAIEGKVLLAGRTQMTDENAFGIVIINFTTQAEANELMKSDPAIRPTSRCNGRIARGFRLTSPSLSQPASAAELRRKASQSA